MSEAYKKFTAQDYAIVPFNAHKQYSYGSSSAASNQVTHYATQWTSESISLYSTSSGPTGGDTINTIKYNQIDHLFYKDFLTNHANLFGDFHYQYHKRNLYEKANILSIPEGLYGDEIKPKSFYLSSSNHVIVDDGYGNLLLNNLDIHNYPTDLRANVFRLDPIKGFKHYDLGLFNDYALKLLDPQHPEAGTYKVFWKKGKINPNAPKTYSTHGDIHEIDDSYFRNPFKYQSVNFNTSSLGDDNHKFPCITLNGTTGSKVIVPHDERFNFDTKDNFAVSFNMQPNTLDYEGVGVPLGAKAKFQGGYIFNVTGDYAYIVKPELQTNLGGEKIKNGSFNNGTNDWDELNNSSLVVGDYGGRSNVANINILGTALSDRIKQDFHYVSGKAYKVSVDVYLVNGSFRVDAPDGSAPGNFVSTSTVGSWQTLTGYFTAAATGTNDIWIRSSAAVSQFYVSNISVKEVSYFDDTLGYTNVTGIGGGETTTNNINKRDNGFLSFHVDKPKSGFNDWWLPNKEELNEIFTILKPYKNNNFIGINNNGKPTKSLDVNENKLVISTQHDNLNYQIWNELFTTGNDANGDAVYPNDYQSYTTDHAKDSPAVFQYLVVRKVNISELDSYRRDIIGKSTTKTIIPTAMEGRSEILNTSISGNMQPMDIPAESQFPFEIYMKNQTLYFDRADQTKKLSLNCTLLNSEEKTQHILCQKSASRMEIYVDGDLKAEGDASLLGSTRNRANLYIGSKGTTSKPDSYLNNTQFRYFNGNLSNINIWENGFVSSSGEISAISQSVNASPYIGNIFYKHGFATITHPNYYSVLGSIGIGEMAIESDFAVDSKFHTGISKLEFQGTHKIREWEYQCTVEEHEYNSTMNTSARKSLSNNIYELANFTTSSLFKPYITTIGLYDKHNNLLVVGKLNQPVKTSNETDTTFIIRWDT